MERTATIGTKPEPGGRASVPGSFFAKLMLPFAVPVALTLVAALVVGERWPRTIPPGSGLKLAGLVATATVGGIVWSFAVRGIADRRVHRFAALLCAATGLLGWPVWSVGLLPSVNGYRLGPERTVTLMLERTETTRQSRSTRINHWAWLRAGPAAPVGSGRYFIPRAVHDRWSRQPPGPVTLTIARGLLGAQVVTGHE